MADVHRHGPGAHAPAQRHQGRLAIVLALAAGYMLAEAVGGFLTGSLALLADAGHMLSDVVALSLGLFAVRLAQRSPTPQRTYGYHRTEILVALAQGALLVGVALALFVEAVQRLGETHEILAGPMLAIAAGGLAVNLAGLALLAGGREHNLNVRGAWLHVLSDALGSAGAILAALLVLAFGWTWADPLASIAIAALIVRSSWSLMREAVSVLMEWAPEHVDVEAIQRQLAAVPNVIAVHDLHVWTIGSGMVALSGHVVVADEREAGKLLQEMSDLLHERFGIDHATLQIETEAFREPGGVCFP
jgi:cobalt-zinc-cadmium efflux system protein